MSQTDVKAAGYTSRQAKLALVSLLIIYILSILSLQGFIFVYDKIGHDLNAQAQAPLITAIPTIVLGIVCFIYGSLGDYVSLKKMAILGVVLFVAGSLLGFFLHMSVWLVIIARAIQTAGGQVSGSIYLVIAARYLETKEKVVFFGIFTAAYQLSSAIGVLTAGYLSQLNWAILFLIPLISLAFLPLLLPNLPESVKGKVRIDVTGLVIFGLAIGLLTVFFTNRTWWILGLSVVLFVVFGLYISKAKEPFITTAFFRNTRWIKGISLIFFFYFVNFSFSPLYSVIGKHLYNLDPGKISLVLLPGYIVATIVGTSSGLIVHRIGRSAALFVASSFIIIGCLVGAFVVTSGTVWLAIASCLYYGGMGMLFSPVVDTVLSTLPSDQLGRGIGMNDLMINVSASIGAAIFGGIMVNNSLGAFSLIGAKGYGATFSNLFLAFAGVAIVGLLVYIFTRRSIERNSSKHVTAEGEKPVDSPC